VSMLVELTVLIATLVGLLLGICCIYWVKAPPSARHAWWGRRLFVATLLSLGGTALFAAIVHADGLAPLGLLSGLLTVAMLWESPAPALPDVDE
jgi:energy-converting hydrogenase Eha subunit A